MNNLTTFNFTVIGVVQSCFKEKFGIPRQPGLAPSARARVLILPPFASVEAFSGLEQCSHIWLQFIFHGASRVEKADTTRQNDFNTPPNKWQSTVRPPRLGGNKRLGVFATRSPNRPNPIGLSVVAFHGLQQEAGALYLNIAGVDLLDGTPVLDIKPYLPYVDCIADAFNQVAPSAPEHCPVVFSEQAERFCKSYTTTAWPNNHAVATDDLSTFIREILQQDPRPQYQKFDAERVYGMRILDLNVRWRYCFAEPNMRPDFRILVTEILRAE